MGSMQTDKHLKLRANPDSGLGKCIAYLQEHPMNQQTLAGQTLLARFLPFVMDRNDPQFEAISIQCVQQCLSWARAIQQYACLNMVEEVMEMNAPTVRGRLSSNAQLVKEQMIPDEQGESDDDFLVSEQEKRRVSGEDLMSSMGLF